MHVLESDPELGGCPGNGLHLFCFTGMHTTNQVIACSLICNRNLAYGEGTRLDYYDVISTADEFGMAIMTLNLAWQGYKTRQLKD
jgi:hypothetical protein